MQTGCSAKVHWPPTMCPWWLVAPQSGVTLCNAGCCRPLVLRHDGADRVDSTGLPLGSLAKGPYTDKNIRLDPAITLSSIRAASQKRKILMAISTGKNASSFVAGSRERGRACDDRRRPARCRQFSQHSYATGRYDTAHYSSPRLTPLALGERPTAPRFGSAPRIWS